jgi:multidrug transporter EmrE-like cation transporter
MNALLLAYSLLGLAIISEVIGSTFLVKSEGFSKNISKYYGPSSIQSSVLSTITSY